MVLDCDRFVVVTSAKPRRQRRVCVRASRAIRRCTRQKVQFWYESSFVLLLTNLSHHFALSVRSDAYFVINFCFVSATVNWQVLSFFTKTRIESIHWYYNLPTMDWMELCTRALKIFLLWCITFLFCIFISVILATRLTHTRWVWWYLPWLASSPVFSGLLKCYF